MCSVCAQVKGGEKDQGGGRVWGARDGEREGDRERGQPPGEDGSAELKLTSDTQEVQDAAWISFVSL